MMYCLSVALHLCGSALKKNMFLTVVARHLGAACCAFCTLCAPSFADPPTAEEAKGIDFFEAKIRPVLAVHCYKCHSTEANKAEGGLQVDTRDRIRAGGDRGPAIVPRDPKSSILLTAISHADEDLQMPPKKERLPQSVIADIRT